MDENISLTVVADIGCGELSFSLNLYYFPQVDRCKNSGYAVNAVYPVFGALHALFILPGLARKKGDGKGVDTWRKRFCLKHY